MYFNRRISGNLAQGVALVFAAAALSSCDDTKSYAELLTEEAHYINNYLSTQNVIMDIPADGAFVTGEDAPFYRLDEDCNVYMRIIDRGNTDMMAEADQEVFFRFDRYNLCVFDAATGDLGSSWGNLSDLDLGSTSFRYGNYALSSSSQWGSGLQMPLAYVGMNSIVELVIRSQYGLSTEISQVTPYLYRVTYMLEGTLGGEE